MIPGWTLSRLLLHWAFLHLSNWNVHGNVILNSFDWHGSFTNLLKQGRFSLLFYCFNLFTFSIYFLMFWLICKDLRLLCRSDIGHRLNLFYEVFINRRLNWRFWQGRLDGFAKIFLHFLHAISFWFHLVYVGERYFVARIQIAFSLFVCFSWLIFLFLHWAIILLRHVRVLEIAWEAISNMLMTGFFLIFIEALNLYFFSRYRCCLHGYLVRSCIFSSEVFSDLLF